MTSDVRRYAEAVPLAAIIALGFGPLQVTGFARDDEKPTVRMRRLRDSTSGLLAAVDSAGSVARRLVMVLAASGYRLSAERLAFETPGVDPDVLADAVERLAVGGLIDRTADGDIVVSDEFASLLQPVGVSLGDKNAITSDGLTEICRGLGLLVPSRKQEKIDAITALYADPDGCERVRSVLSRKAWELLGRIASTAGPGEIEPERVGLDRYVASLASVSRVRYSGPPRNADAGPLFELTRRGIVGVTDWETTLWIWAEAWPIVDRPFYRDWQHVERPAQVAIDEVAPAVPKIVGVVDRILGMWETTPGQALKNAEPRIAKTAVKSLAKSFGVDEPTVDLATRTMISTGLVLRNVLSESGRGRKRRTEEGWIPDPAMVDAWRAMSPAARWTRIVAEWTRPSEEPGVQLLVNRLLVLWELANLPMGEGFADEHAWTAWFEDRHGSLGVAEAAAECLADLRVLGVVAPSPSVALTPLGRAALDDPDSVGELLAADVEHATVQADLTVVAPPGLRHELAARLDAIATVESEGAVTVYRLHADRITKQVQSGESADEIVAFLTGLAGGSLPDTVERLVHDAAKRAGQIQIVSASTVVIVADPADLAVACSAKAARLTAVSDTVAVSELPYAKVQAALDRKGLVVDVAVESTSTRPARSSVDGAEELRRQAARYREIERRSGQHRSGLYADTLDARAELLANPAARLTVEGPLAPTASALDAADTD